MCVHRIDSGVDPAREHKVEECDMTGLPLGQAGGQFLGRRQSRAGRRDIAFAHQDLSLAGMGQRETGVMLDGAIIGFDRAGIEDQRQFGGLDIGIPRDGGRGG